MLCAPGELPNEPRVDCAEGQVGRCCDAAFGKQPFEFTGREIGVEDKSGAIAHEVEMSGGFERLASRCGAAVLPHDCPMKEFPGLAVPNHDRLSLIRDPDG